MTISIIVPQRGLGMRFSGDLPDNNTRTRPTRYGRLPRRTTPQQRLADFLTRCRPGYRLQQALRQLTRPRPLSP